MRKHYSTRKIVKVRLGRGRKEIGTLVGHSDAYNVVC
jgi:small nuclear ribonucleoprotein (snRNP)-like protein